MFKLLLGHAGVDQFADRRPPQAQAHVQDQEADHGCGQRLEEGVARQAAADAHCHHQ